MVIDGCAELEAATEVTFDLSPIVYVVAGVCNEDVVGRS